MWTRDIGLEPEIAKATLETVSHAVEVSLTHFFSHSGIILLPSGAKCETIPLVQVGKRFGTMEKVVSGVMFPVVDTPGDCVSVMFSESISSKAVGDAHKWDDRLLRLKDNAATLVSPLSNALNLPELGDPSFIFDMQGAAVQAMAAHASNERTSAAVISIHLNGLDTGEWANILVIIGAEHFQPRRALRRAA